MRAMNTSVVLIATALGTPLAGAADCDVLRQVMAQAETRFESLKGAYEETVEGATFYHATVALSALPDCSVMEDEGERSFTCSNGAGRSRVEVALDTADRLVAACGFRIRDTHDYSRGKRTSKVYEVITDDRKLVKISTSSFDGRRTSVRLRVSRP
jgi:hypothetical protein